LIFKCFFYSKSQMVCIAKILGPKIGFFLMHTSLFSVLIHHLHSEVRWVTFRKVFPLLLNTSSRTIVYQSPNRGALKPHNNLTNKKINNATYRRCLSAGKPPFQRAACLMHI